MEHKKHDMTRDEILTMARECHINMPSEVYADEVSFKQLERFATLVRNQALEDATEAAVDAVAFNGGSVQMEAHVRQAIRKMKEEV